MQGWKIYCCHTLGSLLSVLDGNNDLSYCSNSISYLYSGDTTVLSCNKYFLLLKYMLQDTLMSTFEWLSANSFLLNEENTQTGIFGLRKYPEINYPSPNVEEIFIGVTFDQSLSWSHHINHLCTRQSPLTYLFRRLSVLIPSDYQKQSILHSSSRFSAMG